MLQKLTSANIRSRFLAFFEKRGHSSIPSSPLVTTDEKGVTNATLFNTAGMQPLVPYLLGKPYMVDGKKVIRLVNSQKCVRTVDIDDIGDKTHATFFEMLGNWSLGDYFKREAIQWSYEFLTSKSDVPGDQGLGLDPNQLYVTVYEGDSSTSSGQAPIPRDDDAANIWREIFIKNGIQAGGNTTKGERGRIFYLPAKNNWWEAGDNGPCGPDTEMFYDISNKFGGKLLSHMEYVTADEALDVVEVWNDVFMQYEKKDAKIIGKLPKPSVDTGAGLERLTMILQGVDNIYDTDLLKPIMEKIISLETKPVDKENVLKNYDKTKARRIVADHLRAAVFLMADGVTVSNQGRGYLLKRLIRRAARYSYFALGVQSLADLVKDVTVIYKYQYPNLIKESGTIISSIWDEEHRFRKTYFEGLKQFEKIYSKPVASYEGYEPRDLAEQIKNSPKLIPGFIAFELFSTFGFPIELTIEIAKQKGLEIDLVSFEAEFKKHQDLSRAGAEQKFKGGLANANDPMVVRYHTATHLLHQALHDVLGESEGNQKGSNITTERLRFDFTGVKLTDEQKKRIENIVNEKIVAALPINNVVLSHKEADKTGARHFFGEKYGEEISIYFIGPISRGSTSSIEDIKNAYSKEFCGGPHVKNTHELAGPEGKWRFKIQKEEAVSQGVRRIKAILC